MEIDARWNDTLFICDLDGTLLDSSGKVSPKTDAVFGRLMNEPNLHITFATARSYQTAYKTIDQLSGRLPFITNNGAFVYEPQNRVPIKANYLSQADAIFLSYIILTCGAHPFVFAHQAKGVETVTWAAGHESEGMRHFLHRRAGDPRLRPLNQDWSTNIMGGQVFSVILMDEKERLEPFYQLLRQDGRFSLIFQQELYRSEYWLFIQAKETDKGQSARFLKESLNLDRIVAFGDSPNDLPLFEMADESYAVANAVPELKAVADAVIAGNDEDAVADFISGTLLTTPKEDIAAKRLFDQGAGGLL
ncbi:MAG: HAD family hydrolase [Fastidiosipilaceae bacterium]|jgi:Cof subfamily protein (haloacid dehalogenase superfamily)